MSTSNQTYKELAIPYFRETFECIERDALVAKGFRKDPEPWRFLSDKYMIRIDVLPFGGIEDDHMVSFNDRYTDLHVLGFQQVLEAAEPILVEESIANIPTLPGMVILKLIA